MALCGIPRIDDLRCGAATAAPIEAGDPDRDSVGLVQQMLGGLGHAGLPNLLSPDYGVFGSRTIAAVEQFRAAQGLPPGSHIDAQCLQTLVEQSASDPVASRGYITLVLDFAYSGLSKILSVVAQMEGAGKFSAMNLNTDKAGMSFGLIQWAQKPGRLAEVLEAFANASAGDFANIFGGNDVSAKMVAHTQLTNGGIDPATGITTDPEFDLVKEPWVSRFSKAALFKPFQQAQVRTALKDFSASQSRIKQYAPQLTTERGIGFMLDLANQFGDGGARKIYQAVARDGMAIGDLLEAMADESVVRMQDPMKAGTQARRQHFLATAFLSDGPFDDAAGATVAV